MIPLELYILLASIMFTIGLYGLVTQKNGVKLMMCIELLLNSANINLVAFSAYQPNMNGQVFALFSIALAAAEAGVGFAILIALYRLYGTIDLDNINTMNKSALVEYAYANYEQKLSMTQTLPDMRKSVSELVHQFGAVGI